MDRNNVYSSAKVISKNDDSSQDYQLGTFIQNQAVLRPEMQNAQVVLNDREINGNVDPALK